MKLNMMVVMTSWAPVFALSSPAMPPQTMPPITPASSATTRWMGPGRLRWIPTQVAVIPPISICPWAPMLNSPARKASAIPRLARISGVLAKRVSERA